MRTKHTKTSQWVSSWPSIGFVSALLLLMMTSFLAPVPSKGAPAVELPPGITKLALDTAFNNQTDCDIPTPLPKPVTYPVGTTQIAYQIVVDPALVQSVSVSFDKGFGGSTFEENCNKSIVHQGQPRQVQWGQTIRRVDNSPLPPDTYTLRVFLNGSPQPSVEMAFTLPTQVTDTPTPTATDTPTATLTVTDTPTNTPTACPTDTAPGPDGCATITPTSTPTMTPTILPTVTSTPTVTPTSTPYQLNLPIVHLRPLPETPRLNAIDNSDNDGNFTVVWDTARWADSYALEEDNDPAFATAIIQSANAATAWAATAKPAGTYYYRVRALNQWGASGWSNVAAVQVSPPTTFYSSMDATALEGAPAINFGEVVDMWVGYDRASCHQGVPDLKIGRSLLMFDLAAIPPQTPITQATVRVRLVNACWRGTGTRTVTAHRSSELWDEKTVTWDNQPAQGEAVGSFEIALNDIGPNEYLIDVTELVRSWINGTQPNYGLILYGPENADNNSARFGFATKEWDDDGDEPRLTITYATTRRVDSTTDQPDPALFTNCQTMADGMTSCSLLNPSAKGIGH